MSFKQTRLETVWFTGVGLGFVSVCVSAWLRGSDTVSRVGLFAKGLILLLLFSLFFAWILLGLDYLVKVARGRKKLPAVDPHVRHYIEAFLAFAIIELAAIAFVLWHPFGYVASISVAVAALIAASLLAGHYGRKLRQQPDFERKLNEFESRVSKSTDDPSEPARWVP